jgi:hypothetical protein
MSVRSAFHFRMYADHIGAFNNYTEIDSAERARIGLGSFVANFDALIDAFATSEFDWNKTAIVVVEPTELTTAGGYHLYDGAHRLALALFHSSDRRVPVFVASAGPRWAFRSRFFETRGMARRYVDHAAAMLPLLLPRETRIVVLFSGAPVRRRTFLDALGRGGDILHERVRTLRRGTHATQNLICALESSFRKNINDAAESRSPPESCFSAGAARRRFNSANSAKVGGSESMNRVIAVFVVHTPRRGHQLDAELARLAPGSSTLPDWVFVSRDQAGVDSPVTTLGVAPMLLEHGPTMKFLRRVPPLQFQRLLTDIVQGFSSALSAVRGIIARVAKKTLTTIARKRAASSSSRASAPVSPSVGFDPAEHVVIVLAPMGFSSGTSSYSNSSSISRSSPAATPPTIRIVVADRFAAAVAQAVEIDSTTAIDAVGMQAADSPLRSVRVLNHLYTPAEADNFVYNPERVVHLPGAKIASLASLRDCLERIISAPPDTRHTIRERSDAAREVLWLDGSAGSEK